MFDDLCYCVRVCVGLHFCVAVSVVCADVVMRCVCVIRDGVICVLSCVCD